MIFILVANQSDFKTFRIMALSMGQNAIKLVIDLL